MPEFAELFLDWLQERYSLSYTTLVLGGRVSFNNIIF